VDYEAVVSFFFLGIPDFDLFSLVQHWHWHWVAWRWWFIPSFSWSRLAVSFLWID
jgi:hypothetical protein